MKEKKSYIDNDNERNLVRLTQGTKKPETKFEEDLKKNIEDIRKKGGIVEIPSDL